MTIAAIAICLFGIVGLATALSLLDTWMQARASFWSVFRERQLLDAGFIPQVEASETRLRQPLHRSARNVPARRVRTRGFGGRQRSTLGSIQADSLQAVG